MNRVAYRVGYRVALMTWVMAVCLFALVSPGVQINMVESWDNGQLNGWVVESPYGVSLTNAANYLQIAFSEQSILMPLEDGVKAGVDASGSAFYGDYITMGASSIDFSLMTDGHLPAVIRLVLHSSVSGREWSYAPLDVSDQAGVWVTNTVPLAYSCGKWQLGGLGATEEMFLADLQSVDRVGIRIMQNGGSAQAYCIDDFRLNGPFGTIRGKVTYKGYQSGSVRVIAAATASDWTGLYSTNISGAGSYQLDNVRLGSNYWIKAYIDSNTNGVPDPWEAKGEYPSNALNLLVSSDNVDIDLSETKTADGIPIWWVLKNFSGGEDSSATADPDGDGMNNWQEYLAGTDPNNADSVFKTKVDAKVSDTGIVLKWKSVYVGQTFGIWRCTNLSVGFELLKGGVTATPPENSFQDTTAIGNGPFYYKVTIE